VADSCFAVKVSDTTMMKKEQMMVSKKLSFIILKIIN